MARPTYDSAGRGLALDLANTVILLPAGREADLLSSPSDLSHWLRSEEPWLGPTPKEIALRLADFRELRRAIRDLFEAAVGRTAIPEMAVEVVNAASAAVPSYPVLDVGDPRHPVTTEAGAVGGRTAALLAAIARSAIEIVGGPERERLRRCPATRCGRFFRSSRRGRRWCSDACGNRARVARHLERRRAAG